MGLLDGKVALVTGSGRGLGRACAQTFAREGAKVVVATRTPGNGEETVRLISDAGGDAVFARTDVAKSADVQVMVQTAVDTYGGLDCGRQQRGAQCWSTPCRRDTRGGLAPIDGREPHRRIPLHQVRSPRDAAAAAARSSMWAPATNSAHAEG